MTTDQWKELKERFREKFTIVYEAVEPLPDIPHATVDVVELETPMGSLRCEFTTKPRTLDRKVLAAARIGATAHEEMVYAKNDFVHYLEIFRWDEGRDDWIVVKADRIVDNL